jgi:DNA polymerase-1
VLKNFDSQKTIFLIDGSSFLYRAYYGMRPIYTSAGEAVQAVYNFCRMIKKLVDQYNPHYIVLAWDSKGSTERHALFAEYKATRQIMPADLSTQKQRIKHFADLIGLCQVEEPSVEADDIMFSLATDFKVDNTIVLITGDKDMGQIVGTNVVLCDWFKEELFDRVSLEIKMGFAPEKLPFYYALLGDASDNIPGVKGIGKVTATELVQQFNSLQDLYEHLDAVSKERTRMALVEYKDNAFLSEQLFLLRYHVLGLTKDDLAFDYRNWPQAEPLFKELEFKSLLKGLESYGVVQEQQPVLSQVKGYNFITVTQHEQLLEVINIIKAKGFCALDTETDSLDALQSQLVGISLCVEEGTAYYIPCGHSTIEPQLLRDEVLQLLKPMLTDATIKKYLQHAKYDRLVLSQYGVVINGIVFDTMIAGHLVTEDWQRVGLKYLSKYYLKEDMLTFADVVLKNGYKNFAQVPLALATEYAAADAHQTLRLVPLLQQELERQSMHDLFYQIEFPLMEILYDMELEGITLNQTLLKCLNEQVTKDLTVIEQKILVLVPHHKELNLNSPKQLERLLFHDLQLPPQKKTKTGFSTDQEVLEELAIIHPVPGLIIQYRELFKLKSTYLDALPAAVNPRDGRIHTTFSQTSVATGRLASSDPNLQNIPVHTNLYDIHVRTAFRPPQGCVFLSADYSQIELRVVGFLSGDTALCDAFVTGLDIHTQTAAKLFDVAISQVSHEQRQLGKRINFSILYGMTPYGLSQDLNIPYKDAKHYIEKYFAQYPAVLQWMEGVIEETKQHGYVTTHWGRRRYIPGIYEKNKTLYELARRVAVNTKGQGTAAELMKLGMINLSKALSEQLPEAKIVLQIHDELILSIPDGQEEHAQKLVKAILETIVNWSIPLVVDTRIGNNWQDVTK